MDPESVAPRTRLLQVAISVFWAFTTAGVVFGYAALKPVLLDAGVYSEFCRHGEKFCEQSDTRLNFMFTIATTVTNGCALPAGSVLDKIGPRKTTIVGAIIFLLGNVLFGMQIINGVIDTYLIGYALIALGSVAMFLSMFHLSNAFPQYSGVILAAITGAFDASSVPYLIYRQVYTKLDGNPSIRTFFWAYTVFPILIILQQLLFGPPLIYTREPTFPTITTTEPLSTSHDSQDFDDLARARSPRNLTMTPHDDPVASGFSRLSYHVVPGTGDDEEEDEVKALDRGKGDGVVGVMFGKSLKEQLLSSWFWIICGYLFVAMTRTNWYLATVQSQLEWYTKNPELADKLTTAFVILLPAAGIVGIPFVGMLLDHRPSIEASIVLIFFGIGFGILTILPHSVPQLIGIGILVFNRPLLYTFISDIFAKVFGFANFGKLYGLAMTMSGLLGLSISAMDVATKSRFGGDFTPINVVLLVLGVITNVALTVRIYLHVRKGRIALE